MFLPIKFKWSTKSYEFAERSDKSNLYILSRDNLGIYLHQRLSQYKGLPYFKWCGKGSQSGPKVLNLWFSCLYTMWLVRFFTANQNLIPVLLQSQSMTQKDLGQSIVTWSTHHVEARRIEEEAAMFLANFAAVFWLWTRGNNYFIWLGQSTFIYCVGVYHSTRMCDKQGSVLQFYMLQIFLGPK